MAGFAGLTGRSMRCRRRTAVVGHSEGGSIAALMSADPSPPAASVSLAGMIAPFAEQMTLQEVLTGRDEGADAMYEPAVRAYYVKVEALARIANRQAMSRLECPLSARHCRLAEVRNRPVFCL